jgi:hypothetical protein
MELPTVDSELMLANRQMRRCEVVWIHPKWRFYIVEFTTELGWKFRETFYFRDRDPDGPPLPEHIRKEREAPHKRRGSGRGWHSKPKIGTLYSPSMR